MTQLGAAARRAGQRALREGAEKLVGVDSIGIGLLPLAEELLARARTPSPMRDSYATMVAMSKHARAVMCLSAAVAVSGCGGAGGVAKEVGTAACRQAASGLSSPTARQIADQACQAGAAGKLDQATTATRKAARHACLDKIQEIVDPVARRQVEALCPTVK